MNGLMEIARYKESARPEIPHSKMFPFALAGGLFIFKEVREYWMRRKYIMHCLILII